MALEPSPTMPRKAPATKGPRDTASPSRGQVAYQGSRPQEFIPEGVSPLRNMADEPLVSRDPLLNSAVQDVLTALREDMLPAETQLALVEAMSPASRREVVAKIAGLDSSVLMTFKDQIQLVDKALRRIVNPDGTAKDTDGAGLSMKDALNLSLRVTQVLVKDLPKIYTLDKIQRQEAALRKVVERCLNRKQQEEFLRELEKLENGVDE